MYNSTCTSIKLIRASISFQVVPHFSFLYLALIPTRHASIYMIEKESSGDKGCKACQSSSNFIKNIRMFVLFYKYEKIIILNTFQLNIQCKKTAIANTCRSNRKNVSFNNYFSLTFPWLLGIFIFHWPLFKIPWQFPDLEKISNFPDFSSPLATLYKCTSNLF